jgi:hemerythrin-like metal-binding protein
MTPAIDTSNLFDHSAFAELLNALLDLLDDKAPESEIDEQLQRLQRHLQQQFAAEELAMQENNFPAAEAHKKHHDHALNKLDQRIAQWQREHDSKVLMDYMENELAEWFVSHVNIRDYVTARHLSLPRQTDT